MATIIDSLLVTLGLDASKFKSEKAKVDGCLRETGKQADKTAKTVAQFFAVVGGTMAIKRFIADQIEANAALDRFSKNLNESVENISALGNAAELAGGSAEGLRGTMDMLSKSQTELMLTGQSGLIPFFSALNISLADTSGKARPVSELMLDLADRFGKMDRTTANNMGRMMGIDQGTMQLLLRGRAEVEALILKQKEYNAVTKKQAEESSLARESIVALKQGAEAFGRSLLSAAMPAIEMLLDLFKKFGDWVNENGEFVNNFLVILAGGLVLVGAAITPINLTALAVLGLAAAIAALWQDYQVWKRGGDSFIKDWGEWETAIYGAADALKFLKNFLVDTLIRAVALGDALLSLAKGDLEGAKVAGKALLFGIPGAGLNSPPTAAPSASTAPASAQAKMSAIEKQYGLPAGMLDSIWSAESGRGKSMKSAAGAEGHFQFMPGTAKQYGLANPYDFDTSADAAGRYMRDLLKHYGGDVKKAVAAYNWGAGNVDRKGLENAPAETRGYMSKVIGGIPGASMAAAGAGAGQVAASNISNNTRSSQIENNIGEVKVYTQATDAAGIAKDMSKSMEYLFTSQVNPGLS